MKKYSDFKSFLADNWLLLLIAAQPVLDIIAYWNRNSVATVAGLIRLVIMAAMPIYLLVTLKKKKSFIISMSAIALFALLHILNGFRVGYMDPVYDIAYMVKVMQGPVLAICLMYLIRDEKTKNQAMKGLLAAAVIFVSGIVIALATGTWNSTYGAGVGLSGWVIDDNRCANSIITVTLAVFSIAAAALSEKKYVQIGIPALVTFFLIANGTKACYLGLFAMLLGYSFFMIMRRFITKEKIKWVFVSTLLILTVISALVYPVSPRAQVDDSQGAAKSNNRNMFEQMLEENGYGDISAMTMEEKMADPVLKDIYYRFYVAMFGDMSDLYNRFGMDKVFEKFGMTDEVGILGDTRKLKVAYASLIWDECDAFTKLVGYEAGETVVNGIYDMENDYPALLFYYGYLGAGMYLLFILYFVYLIIRRLVMDFRGSFNMENFTLLVCLMLHLGLAQFSGHVMRRPNVSIYLAIILALIYYKTRLCPIDRRKAEEA